MTKFYQQRLARHSKKMMRYMRYVLNDHFLLVSLFLLGALGFYYSQFLKSLPLGFFWGRPIVLCIWIAMLFVGKLATFTEEADKVFLLPKEKQMDGYLKKAVTYSFWLPFLFSMIIGGMTMPLLVVSTGWSFSIFFLFLISFGLVKMSHLWIQKYGLKQITQEQYAVLMSGWFFGMLITFTAGLFVSPLISPLMAFVQLVIFYVILQRQSREKSLDWEKMIQKEKNRMYQIYQFIHLFTDVPEIVSGIKRRKMFDLLFVRIKRQQQSTYLYLYARSFIRVSEFSGLWLRLVLLGGLILLTIQEVWFSLSIAGVFIYLLGFQLIPIYTQFDYMVMTKLYPVSSDQKRKATSQLITGLLSISACIFGLCAIIALPSLEEAILEWAILLLEVFFFKQFYVPYRLKKSFI